MTSPVEFKVKSQTMTFMMPSRYKLNSLPDPQDESISLSRQPGRLMAALRFNGTIDEELWQQKERQLLQELASSRYTHCQWTS